MESACRRHRVLSIPSVSNAASRTLALAEGAWDHLTSEVWDPVFYR